MTGQQVAIELEGTAGRASYVGTVDPEDAARVRQVLAGDAGLKRVRLVDDDDTEGHAATAVARVIIGDDDVEGHAISIHFPSAAEADAFRKRLLLTGVLVGSVALGAVAGVAATGDRVTPQAGLSGADQAYADRLSGQAEAQAGLSQADQAYADRLSGQAEAQAGLSQADQTYADRLSGQAEASDDEAAGGPTAR